MKILNLLILTFLLIPHAAIAQTQIQTKSDQAETSENIFKFKKTSHSKICMVNNTAFDKDQIPVEVDGKTYYGCCPMCKERLEKDPDMRVATDPVSHNKVDKAQAIIGTDETGAVYYFESEETFEAFAKNKN